MCIFKNKVIIKYRVLFPPVGAQVLPAGNVENLAGNLINKTRINVTFSNKRQLKKEIDEIVGRKHNFEYSRRIFLSQDINLCHTKDIPITGRKFLLQNKNACHRKDIPATGRKFLSLEGNLRH